MTHYHAGRSHEDYCGLISTHEGMCLAVTAPAVQADAADKGTPKFSVTRSGYGRYRIDNANGDCFYVNGEKFSQHVCELLNGSVERAAAATQPATEQVTAEGWQPIETAPDACYVLVWLPNYGLNVAIQTKHPTGDHWWMRDHNEYCYLTHWMKLPEPPSQPVEGEK